MIEILRGIGFEFFDATCATEVIILAGVLVDVPGSLRIDGHPANWVADWLGLINLWCSHLTD